MAKVNLRAGTSWLAIFAGQGIVFASAAAAPVTVTDTINLNQALSSGGGSYTGLFDINSLLPNSSNYTDPLNILSATVSLYGYSNPASQQVVGAYSQYQQTYAGNYYYYYPQTYYQGASYYYAYSCGWFSTCYYTYYYTYPVTYYVQGQGTIYNETEYNTVTTLDNTTDTGSITAGQDTVSGSDTRTVTDNGSTVTSQGSSGGGNGNAEYNYYSSSDMVSDLISGSLSGSGALSAASLALLAQDGQLAFSVIAGSGQFTVTQVSLTATVDQSLPEPSSLSIFGFGLLLVALRARSAKRTDLQQ